MLVLAFLASVLGACSREPTPTTEEFIAQADALVQQDRRHEAIELLMRALRIEPQSGSLRWHLGRLHYQLGALDFAESFLTGALRRGIQPSSVLPLLAQVRLAAEDYRSLFEMEIPTATSSEARAAVLAHQALGYGRLGRFDEAWRNMQQALTLAGDSEPVGVAHARLLLAEGQASEAESLLREVIAAHPNSADALGTLADVVRDSGRLQEAEAIYGRALAHSGFKVNLHLLRAEVRLDLAMIDGAKADAAIVEQALPESFAAHYLRGRLLLIDDQPAKALTHLETANKLQPMHLGTLLYGGVAAYASERSILAEDWLLRVWKEMPGNMQARLLLGAIRYSQQRYAEAERLLLPVPHALPDNAAAKRLLAATLIVQRKADAAVGLLRDLVQQAPQVPRRQLDLSVALLLSGAEDQGLALLRGLLASHPDYRAAYEYLIAYHVRERRWDEAEHWADAYVARYADDPQALYLQGEMYGQAQQPAQAARAFKAAITFQPAHVGANLQLAELHLAEGDEAAALSRYRAIRAQQPDNLFALLGEARLAQSRERFDEALSLLGQAVTAHPLSLPPRLAMARLLLARAEPQRAVAVLSDDAPSAFRRDGEYLYLLADALRAAGAPQTAADRLRELIGMHPDSLPAYRLYARVLRELDDKIALEATLKQMLTLDPQDIEARLELVRLHIATERLGLAEQLLRPVLQDRGRPPAADLLHGVILSAGGESRRAADVLRRAHQRIPSEISLLALANAEADAGFLEDAIARQAAWLVEHGDAVEVRINLAGHFLSAGRTEDAIAQYRAALALAPDHLVALNNLAWFTMEQDVEQALGFAARAFELRPESQEVAHTLVSAQVSAERWRDAELTLDRALARHPTAPDLLWLSAQVQHRKGRPERALAALARMLEKDLPEEAQERANSLRLQIENELRAQAGASSS